MPCTCTRCPSTGLGSRRSKAQRDIVTESDRALVGVAQREEDEAAVRVVAQVADLALDPQRRQLVDAPREAAIDVRDGVDASRRRLCGRRQRMRSVMGCARRSAVSDYGAENAEMYMSGNHSDEDAFGQLRRAAAREQVARVVQVGVAQRNALGDLLRAAGLDEY